MSSAIALSPGSEEIAPGPRHHVGALRMIKSSLAIE